MEVAFPDRGDDDLPEFDVDGERRRVIEDRHTHEEHLDEQTRDI